VNSFEEFVSEFSHIHSPEAHLSWDLLPFLGLPIVVPFALFLIFFIFYFLLRKPCFWDSKTRK